MLEEEDPAFSLGSATGGTIEIQFSDNDNNMGWKDWEVILIVVDAFDFDTGGLIFSASSFSNELEVNALAEINDTGMLDISITSLWGDFYVGQSVLTVETADASVPEPGILGILSLGLLGLGIAHRIRKS